MPSNTHQRADAGPHTAGAHVYRSGGPGANVHVHTPAYGFGNTHGRGIFGHGYYSGCASLRSHVPYTAGFGLLLLAAGIIGLASSLFSGLGAALLIIGVIVALGTLLSNDVVNRSCCAAL